MAPIFGTLLVVYGATGALVALAFVTLGIDRVDPAARDASPLFRLLVFPGCALLFPLVLARWRAARREVRR